MGGGHAGGQLGWIHFGLGDAESASVTVLWPDGEGGPAMPAEVDAFGIITPRLDRDRAVGAAAMTARGAAVHARLEAVTLPDFGLPTAMPELPIALYAERMARLRERAEAAGYQRMVIYARSGAQRQPGVPDRLRPALRGGRADRGAGWRSGRSGRQRVLGHGRCGAVADAAASVPGLQPPDPAARSLEAARGDPARGGHRTWKSCRALRVEGVCGSGDERRAGLPRRRAPRDRRRQRLRRERDRPLHRSDRWDARRQRGRAARRLRVGKLPHLAGRADDSSAGCGRA